MTQHVRQLDRFGCAVACMAMVRGVPYETVRADMSEVGRGHDFMSWQDYLARHGFAAQMAWHTDQISQVKRDPWPLQPWAAVHLCCVDAGCGSASHLVVMLADGIVLDPASEGPRRLSDYPSVAYIAAIHPVAGGVSAPVAQGEPVAWAYEINVTTAPAEELWIKAFQGSEPERGLSVRNIRPLYAAPAAPRSADLPGREALLNVLAGINPNSEAEDYEYRIDGEYNTTDFEKGMLEDFAAGLIEKIRSEVLALLTPPSPTQEMRAAEAPTAPRSGTGVTVEEIAARITAYREARAKFGGTSGEATAERTKLYDLEEQLRDGAALLQAPRPGETDAARDVLAERRRQVEAEGWTPEHDDEHSDGAMAEAAACYLLGLRQYAPGPATNQDRERERYITEVWPWHARWLKRQGPRRDLVKAGALILAEIERLDRAAGGEDRGGE